MIECLSNIRFAKSLSNWRLARTFFFQITQKGKETVRNNAVPTIMRYDPTTKGIAASAEDPPIMKYAPTRNAPSPKGHAASSDPVTPGIKAQASL